MEDFGKFLALPDVDFTVMAKNGNPPICDNLADYPKHVWSGLFVALGLDFEILLSLSLSTGPK